jgi:hypothetical protein
VATEPANPFWDGYSRSPQMTAALIAALSEALYANPSMRLGQLLTIKGPHDDLWNIYDETWVHVLTPRTAEDLP